MTTRRSMTDPEDEGWAAEDTTRVAAAEEERLLTAQVRFKRVTRKADRLLDEQEAAGRTLRVTPASAFPIEAVRWGWANRMPVGELTLVPGREGVGKSTFFAWLAARLTRGELPGAWYGQPRAVLYSATEDSWRHTLAPRLLAAGADMDMVFRLDVVTADGSVGKLSLPLDCRHLPTLAVDTRAVALLCDPMISLVSDNVNTFKAQELRRALEPLKAAAEEAALMVAGLIHFNKVKDTDILSMISGSRAWSEVARAVVAIARDKDAERYTCVVSQVKNNLGRTDIPHLSYTINTTVLVDRHGGDVPIGTLEWTGESDRGAEDLLSDRVQRNNSGELVQNVTAFVVERFVATGAPVTAGEVIARFPDEKSDLLRKTLQRCVERTMLRRPAHGLYAPGTAQEVCSTPGCANFAEHGHPVCKPCREELDAEDRRTRHVQDPLM